MTIGVALILVVSSAGGVSAAKPAEDLDLSVESWCPPQLDGCRQPTDVCATVAEPGRWLSVELQVTDQSDDPRQFVPVFLNYTEHRADGPVERNKTEWTDEEGLVAFSLRNATGVSVETRGDEAIMLEPTWGTVHVDQSAVPAGTVGGEVQVDASYAVEGHGPKRTPNGSVTVAIPSADHRSATVSAETGALTGAVTDTKAGEQTYPATSSSICGLPAADDAGLAIQWAPGDVADLAIACDDEAVGNTALNCTANGFDRYGNPVEPSDATWRANATHEDDHTGFIVDEGPQASYLLPGQGGPVNFHVRQGNATASTTVVAEDNAAPEIDHIPEETEVGQPVSIQLFDPSGVANATITYEGQELDSVQGGASGTVTLEPVFRASGLYEVRILAEDDVGHDADITTTLSVKGSSDGPSSSGSSSTGSSRSGSSGGSAASDTPDEGDTPTRVEADRVAANHFRTQAPVDDGSTPTVATPSGDLAVEVETRAHDELVVDHRRAVDVPEGLAARPVTTFDVSVSTTDGHEADIDRATVETRLDETSFDGDASELALYHWDGQAWRELATEIAEKRDGSLLLRSEVTDLSPFVVGLPATDDARADLAADGSQELPRTYSGEIDVREPPREIVAETDDGLVSLTVNLTREGVHQLELTLRGDPPTETPDAVTEEGRYLEGSVRGPDGRARDLVSLTESLTFDASAFSEGEGSMVPVAIDRGEWRPLSASVTTSGSNVTIATHDSADLLRGVLADAEPPRVGLQDPLPDEIAGSEAVTVVANDNLAVDEVRLVAEGAVLDEDGQRPFELAFDAGNLTAGATELRLEAVDRAGNVGDTLRSVTVAEEGRLEEAGRDPPAAGEASGDAEPAPVPGLEVLALVLAVSSALALRPRHR